MFKMPEKIIYALPEQIGNYDLFVGRKKNSITFLENGTKTLKETLHKARLL